MSVRFMPSTADPIPQFETKFAYDGSSNVEYAGYSEPGAGTDEARWLIVKYTYSAGLVTGMLFASDQRSFDKVWDDRATYFA